MDTKAAWLVGLTALAASAAGAQAPAMPPDGPGGAIDYAQEGNWLCRPGRADACSASLDAVAYDRAGTRAPVPFVPAADPPVDCFYVYPTVSNDSAAYSDMAPGEEEKRAALVQAARFRAACRLFVPTYRQLTMTAVRAVAGGAKVPGGALDHGRNYDDILAAWRAYLRNDNKGRGVVLIGHSQGSVILKRLIAEEIDGRPARKLLVSAILAGNLDLTVKTGSDRGGSFSSVPLCRGARQTGCVIAWSSYAEDDDAAARVFGGGARAGETAACVNPAALGGGSAPLDGFVPRPGFASPSDPPFVEQVGQLSGRCVDDGRGNVLRVHVEDGPLAGLLKSGLGRSRLPGWGLHVADISLVQGDLVRVVEAEGRAWTGR